MNEYALNGISIAGVMMGANSVFPGTRGPRVFGSQKPVADLFQHLFKDTATVRNAYESLVL
jgi:hypothetical protein